MIAPMKTNGLKKNLEYGILFTVAEEGHPKTDNIT
jgi:hypothetical protein